MIKILQDKMSFNEDKTCLLPLSQKECRERVRDDQTFINSTRFVQNISNIYIFK